MTASPPIFASPALPSEVLRYIIHHCAWPTTLIVCSSKEHFLASFAHDVASMPGAHPDAPEQTLSSSPEVLTASLQQLGVARHIQAVFVPTVSHLRAYLAAFPAGVNKVPPPPVADGLPSNARLVVYGLLDTHRESSEWSAQALGNTLAVLIETATDLAVQAVVIEPSQQGDELVSMDTLLGEHLPVLNGGSQRYSTAGFADRRVQVRRVLGRWFQFKEVTWKR